MFLLPLFHLEAHTKLIYFDDQATVMYLLKRQKARPDPQVLDPQVLAYFSSVDLVLTVTEAYVITEAIVIENLQAEGSGSSFNGPWPCYFEFFAKSKTT